MFQANIDNAAQLLNQKQTAAALGLSSGRLSQLKKEGRITYADPERRLYDVDQVRAQWERTADVRQSVATETRLKARRKVLESSAIQPPVRQAVQPTSDVDEEMGEEVPEFGPDHHENLKMTASFEKREDFRMKRLQRLTLERTLGLAAEMESAAYTEARIVRDTLLGALPSKLAPALAAITDVFALEQCLREALRAALHGIVREVEAVHGAR